MPQCLSHPIDVPVFTGFGQWVLRLGNTPAECAHDGECQVGAVHAVPACGRNSATPGSAVAATGWPA